jgi:hypothetical protein
MPGNPSLESTPARLEVDAYPHRSGSRYTHVSQAPASVKPDAVAPASSSKSTAVTRAVQSRKSVPVASLDSPQTSTWTGPKHTRIIYRQNRCRDPTDLLTAYNHSAKQNHAKVNSPPFAAWLPRNSSKLRLRTWCAGPYSFPCVSGTFRLQPSGRKQSVVGFAHRAIRVNGTT